MRKTIYISLSIFILIVILVFASTKNESYSNKIESDFGLKNDSLFTKGKTLFKINCSSCHYMGMDKVMTAPALGGITKRRNKEWLYDYTKNSMGMYQKKDSIAIELRNQGWALMNSFPNLSNIELDQIYYFVEERYNMSLKGIPLPIEFEFKMSENKQAKACVHIILKKNDILKVKVSKTRFWRFSCGIENHKQSEFKKTTLKQMFEYDNSISDLNYMTHEFPAQRKSKNAEWE